MRDFCERMNAPVKFHILEVQSKLVINIAHLLQLHAGDKHVSTFSQLCDCIKIGKNKAAVRRDLGQYLTTVSVNFP